jgi:hypothetical protein
MEFRLEGAWQLRAHDFRIHPKTDQDAAANDPFEDEQLHWSFLFIL